MKTYVKIDDDSPWNTKIREVPPATRWTYIASICYAGHNLTDGYIPTGALNLVDGTPKIARELVAAGLWEVCPNGWRVHDYLDHNRSRAEISSIKEKNAANGRKGLATRYQFASQSATDSLSDSLAKRPTTRDLLSGSPLGDGSETNCGLPDPDPEDPQREQRSRDASETPSESLTTSPEIPHSLRAKLIEKYAPVASTEDVEVEIARCLEHHGAKQKKKAFDYGRAAHSWLRGSFGHELLLKIERDARNRPPSDHSEPVSDLASRYNAALAALVAAGKCESAYAAKELLPFEEWRRAEFSEVES